MLASCDEGTYPLGPELEQGDGMTVTFGHILKRKYSCVYAGGEKRVKRSARGGGGEEEGVVPFFDNTPAVLCRTSDTESKQTGQSRRVTKEYLQWPDPVEELTKSTEMKMAFSSSCLLEVSG